MPDLGRRTERWLMYAGPLVLLLALALLHVALLQGALSPAGKALLLGHFGLVLLWQPLVSGGRRLSWAGMLLFGLALAGIGLWLSWGLLLLWGLMLAGVIGGKVFCHPAPRERGFYWLLVVYLVVALNGRVMPELLEGLAEVPAVLPLFANWFALPVLLGAAVLGLPCGGAQAADALDVVGSLIFALVLGGVALGALAFMFVARSDYVWALLQALGSVAGALLLMALVWSPRKGFAGLGLAISRRVLSGGQPFAHWLDEVAELALHEASPEALVRAAMERLAGWPGVQGVFWRCAETEAMTHLGKTSRHVLQLRHGTLEVAVYGQQAFAPTPAWHLDLMLRILAEFHAARLQAQRLQALSFLRAVHETGARSTHELKNLLQSLDALCFAVLDDGGRNPAGVQALLQGQLPEIRRRLDETLQRIRRPREEDLQPRPALGWWQALQARHAEAVLRYQQAGPLAAAALPAALFDCVADNLLRNALEKSGAPAVQVRLVAGEQGCSLSVEDDGAAIETERAASLLLRPLASDTGLGIGLYQAGRLAESAGYVLRLEENRAGCVRFCLSPRG
ncbi:ATP-binding protein [Uliginosibacterium sp. 31-12]|uniref:ATP-binding protein n=1 Tax=Uliginosibacterium sp. 31-12 TaxID=3062781 RepID=UPI0026E1BF49|nr:ATP-binding protein [Uliginosibacterium sp. 31-12]MDO6387412.1 hypothetical protein [Uliginosibacterium sp. 31-12]